MENDSFSEISSNNSIEENFAWTQDDKNINMRNSYIKFPFDLWRNLIKIDLNKTNYDDGEIYQELVCNILQDDVFKNEHFVKENKIYEITKDYIVDDSDSQCYYNIRPDFLIIKIEKNKFIQIINERDYMFRKSDSFLIPEECRFITIIGEAKINTSSSNKKKRQLQNYLSFCDYFNSKQKETFFVILYIFDFSYYNFWQKDFMNNRPIIIGYIPKLYKETYYEVYKGIKEKNNNSKIINCEKIKNDGDNNNLINKDNKNDDLPHAIREKEKKLLTLISSRNISDKEFFKKNIEDFLELMNKLYNSTKEKRKVEDTMIQKKREREDKYLENKRVEEDKYLEKKRAEEDKFLLNNNLQELNKIEYEINSCLSKNQKYKDK